GKVDCMCDLNTKTFYAVKVVENTQKRPFKDQQALQEIIALLKIISLNDKSLLSIYSIEYIPHTLLRVTMEMGRGDLTSLVEYRMINGQLWAETEVNQFIDSVYYYQIEKLKKVG